MKQHPTGLGITTWGRNTVEAAPQSVSCLGESFDALLDFSDRTTSVISSLIVAMPYTKSICL